MTRSMPEDLAVTIHATVVSKPAPDHLVVAADRNPVYAHGLILGHDDLELATLTEEQGWVRSKTGCPVLLEPGDRVRIVPAHIFTCINLHREIDVVNGETNVDCWPVDARGQVR